MSTETLRIHGVPCEDAQVLRARAASGSISVSSYLRELIHDHVSRPTMSEVLAHAAIPRPKPEVDFTEDESNRAAASAGRQLLAESDEEWGSPA